MTPFCDFLFFEGGILVRVIQQLYDKTISAVQMNESTGELFRTTVGVRQ